MKYFITISLFLALALKVFGQQETMLVNGTASYVSSQNVYVKFTTTEGINKGDTLFAKKDSLLTAALLVKDKSSTSAVCSSLLSGKVKVGDEFFARVPKKKESEKVAEKKKETPAIISPDSLPLQQPVVVTPETEERQEQVFKQKIKGRISAASYSNFYGSEETAHRMRYAFTMQGNNISNSRFSTDAYVTFRHTKGEWSEVQDNFNQALKVYSLAVKYDLDKKSSLTLGRKINQRISSMGAIDGLQAEKGFGNFLAGAIAGSRPDYTDYSFNANLLQAGAYLGLASGEGKKYHQTTLAFVEQRNHSKTDRRFVYFQHSDAFFENLSTFASFELDLYENINNEAKSTLNLTNLYLSLRYKFSKKLSLGASYDNRKNIIYYESYKNFIDQLIDDETRQGLRLNVSYRPMKFVTWGVNANWRFQKSDMNLSKNLNSYLNFSRLPLLKASASITANFLQTNYLDSRMFGIRLSKELFPGKLNGDAYFRWVDYDYNNYEYKIHQNIAGVDLSWSITRKLAFHVYYEGTFDSKNETLHRVNTKIIQRF